ncbi:hypothetical protein Mapa_014489 [Marchantia paleacea]|nr:hypothetical protein Mapa_014489 [Marchantia paleacea]
MQGMVNRTPLAGPGPAMKTATVGMLPRLVLLLAVTQSLGTHKSVMLVMGQTVTGGGSWRLLLENAGIASMHTAVTRFNTVIFLDRTNIGESQISLPKGRCRNNPQDQKATRDCSAHSVMFDPSANTVRPLFIFTDTWCSSGQFFPNGTLVQTGGDNEGLRKVRTLKPCLASETCDWVESNDTSLQNGRWYSSNQLLPDGRMIIVGGRQVFTYEFIPRRAAEGTFELPFLQQTNDAQNDNYYPFVHLLPDGRLYIFANRDSILLDYSTNTVVRTYPQIPGEPRNYPSAGSSVMLALDSANNYNDVEILICGGARFGAFRNSAAQFGASQTCGRMMVTGISPRWAMEEMPTRRCMGDMILLPTADVLIINGAQNGSQGWGFASLPVLNPVAYLPGNALGSRFLTYRASTIPRMYHATAVLIPDGRILVAGSNTHQFYTFTGAFPTELRVEAFSPPYTASVYSSHRPRFISYPHQVRYGQAFSVVIGLATAPSNGTVVNLNLVSCPFTTHSFAQGQRLLKLGVTPPVDTGVAQQYRITVTAPPRATVAPPSYYMLFANNNGLPSRAVWVQIS